MRIVLGGGLAVGLLMGLSGCVGVQAKVPVSVPLAMPEPPTRVVMPPVTIPEPIIEDAPPASPPPVTAPVTSPNKPLSTPPPRTAVPPPAPTPTPPTPPEPAPVLQTLENTGDVLKRIQRDMDDANRDLGKVVRNKLPEDAKSQFDLARAFLRQAQEAKESKNYNMAEQLANKAARVASMLAKAPFILSTSF